MILMARLNRSDSRAGYHASFSGSLATSVRSVISEGGYALQFFMGNPRSYHVSSLTENDVKLTKLLVDRFPTTIVAHAPYPVFAATAADNPPCHSNLVSELTTMAQFPQSGVVVHVGSNSSGKKIAQSVDSVLNAVKSDSPRMVLENGAGAGHQYGVTLEELGAIRRHTQHQDNLFFCLDTAHLYASGAYDLRRNEEVDQLFRDAQKYLGGWESVFVVHLNDSKTAYKSRSDRHASLGEGEIWGKSTGSLRYLLDRIGGTPFILETPNTEADWRWLQRWNYA